MPNLWQTENNLAQKKIAPSGIILYAKQSGLTSFSSLGAIKKALHTSKVGHTGTLDSFAEGLMVVLTGSLTRLAPYITAADKKYLAVVKFGSATDTLELNGKVTETSSVPSREQVESVLQTFRGKIQQVPPLYSAIHVDGKRASDIARSGAVAEIPARQVEIFSLELLDYAAFDEKESYALLQIHCSKGTYIRSLARDIAKAVDSCAHLVALRRTAVGAFSLQDAVGFKRLGDFTVASRGVAEDVLCKEGTFTAAKNADTDLLAELQNGLQPFLPSGTVGCGLGALYLDPKRIGDFRNGKPLRKEWFTAANQDSTQLAAFNEYAVFSAEDTFLGLIKSMGSEQSKRLKYGFVVPAAVSGGAAEVGGVPAEADCEN